jgi:hydrogenase nickel incorporation protein HypA/HybF
MHELSLAQEIVDLVGRHVAADQLSFVRAVKVRLGRFSGVVADSLDFCFGAIVNGGPLERARLEIDTEAARVVCAGCHRTAEVEGPELVCPCCGAADVRLVSGSELDVVEVRLEEPLEEDG